MDKGKQFELYAPDKINNAKLLTAAASGTSEWHEARASSIGGSQIGAVLGLNQYESAFSLWAKKTGQVSDFVEDNWAMKFGRAFEEPLLRLWQNENPSFDVYTTGIYQDGTDPFLTASPDALAHNPETGEYIVLEVKTARNYWTDVPPSYRAQVVQYMDVLGLSRAIILGIAGWDWQEYIIELDQFEADAQRAAARRLWKHVMDNTQPDFDGADVTYETVRKMNPDIDLEAEVYIDGVWDLANAQTELDEAKAKFNRQKSEVLSIMGNARHAYFEHDGEKIIVATRQGRGDGIPFLKIKKGKK